MDPKPHGPKTFAPSATPPPRPPGGYTVADVRDGDRFELSDGELLQCHPAGDRHTRSVRDTTVALSTDPAVHLSGVDAGHQLNERTLRAPDVSIGIPQSNGAGWVQGAPLLAIEQASVGQNEEELKTKIRQLLQAGSRYVWVVRLTGVQCVEVYQPKASKKTYQIGEVLTAPGVLKNPVPVAALFDEQIANRVALRNLLERFGYGDASEVVAHGKAATLLLLIDARKIALTPEQRHKIALCTDPDQVDRWAVAAATATTAAELGL